MALVVSIVLHLRNPFVRPVQAFLFSMVLSPKEDPLRGPGLSPDAALTAEQTLHKLPAMDRWARLAVLLVLLPGLLARWSGARRVRRRNDPALAERLFERRTHLALR